MSLTLEEDRLRRLNGYGLEEEDRAPVSTREEREKEGRRETQGLFCDAIPRVGRARVCEIASYTPLPLSLSCLYRPPT